MSFLLKIVQGPNAGAEIALVEGTTISLGRSDSCDIILSDAALAEKACEIEVTSERVMLLLPEGKQARMEPFHVQMLGTSALVIGPAEGAWREIVWEKPRTAEAVAPAEKASPEKGEAEAAAAPAAAHTKKGGIGRFVRRLIGWTILLVLLVVVASVALWYFWPERVSSWTQGRSDRVAEKVRPVVTKVVTTVATWFESKEEKKAKAEALLPKETLEDVVAEYGLETKTLESGAQQVVGDFETRVKRLQATARLYRVQPGIELDFSDRESLTVAITDLLTLLTEGRITLDSLEGRQAKLAGTCYSEGDLRRTLEALSRDVPKLESVDCSLVSEPPPPVAPVVVSTPEPEPMPVVVQLPPPSVEPMEVPAPPPPVVVVEPPAPRPPLPIVGILISPYPCMVLQNGTRIVEGARFGEYVVRRIKEESVELENAAGRIITWRP